MKCPNCQKDGMVQSRAGWLCLSCGHLERTKDSPVAAQIATGKDSHAQMRSAVASHEAADSADTTPASDAPTTEEVNSSPVDANDAPPPPSAKPLWSADNTEPSAPSTPSAPEDELKAVEQAVAEATAQVSANTEAAPATTTDAAAGESSTDSPTPATDSSNDEEPAADDQSEEDQSAKSSDDEAKSTSEADESVSQSDESESSAKAETPDESPAEEPDEPAEPTSELPAGETSVEKPVPAESKDEPSTETKAPETEELSEPNQPEDNDKTDDNDDHDKADLSEAPSNSPAVEAETSETDSETDKEPDDNDDKPSEAAAGSRPEEPAPDEIAEPEAAASKSDANGASLSTPADESTESGAAPQPKESAPAKTAEPDKAPAPAPTPQTAPPAQPLNGKPPLQPATHPRPFNPVRAVKVVGGLVVLALGAAAGYFLVYQPKVALNNYVHHLVASKTANFTATAAGTAQQYRFALQFNAKTNLTDTAKPQVLLTANGALSVTDTPSNGDGSVSANLIVANQTVYAKAKNLPAQLLADDLSSGWYQYKLSDSRLGQCLGASQNLQAILAHLQSTNPPVKTAGFAGLDTVNGAKRPHYKGALDASHLQSYLDTITTGLPAQCRLHAANLTINYDIWPGWNSDRLRLTLANTADHTSTELTLDSGSYGQTPAIQVPSDARPAPNASPSASPSASPKATPTPSATPATSGAAARDTQRKTDLAAYVTAYHATASNGYYQTKPPAVSVTAKDPSTGQPYQVSRNPVTALGQIEYRAGGKCGGPDITPGSSSTRYIALHMKLEGQTDYCLDVK